MPAKSRKQQKWAFAVKGEKWAKAHHFDRVERKAMKAKPKKRKPAAKKKKPAKKMAGYRMPKGKKC